MGAVISILIFRKKFTFKNTIIQNFVPIVGYSFIFGSLFLFDNNSGFPGALAIFPCIGTVLILLSGQENRIIAPDEACLYGEKNNSKIAIWGDSHADQIVYPLAKDFSQHGYSVLEYAIAGCLPLTDIESTNSNRKCSENSRAILEYLVNNEEVHYVLLHAYWIGYFNENLVVPPDILTIKKSLEYVVDTLTKSGKEVFIIDSVPKMKVNPPLYMARRALLKHIAIDEIFLQKEEYEEQTRHINQVLSSTVPKENFLNLSDLLLDSDSHRYLAVKEGIVLYRDDNHLSLFGANFISEEITNRVLHKR